MRPPVTGTVDEWIKGLESKDPDLKALSLEQTRYVVATSLSFPNPFNWGFRDLGPFLIQVPRREVTAIWATEETPRNWFGAHLHHLR